MSPLRWIWAPTVGQEHIPLLRLEVQDEQSITKTQSPASLTRPVDAKLQVEIQLSVGQSTLLQDHVLITHVVQGPTRHRYNEELSAIAQLHVALAGDLKKGVIETCECGRSRGKSRLERRSSLRCPGIKTSEENMIHR